MQRTNSVYVSLPPFLWVVLFVFISPLAFTANGLITCVSLLELPLFVSLLWRRGEPPVLLFIVTFQWLQAAVKIFHANFINVHLNEMIDSTKTEQAVWLCLLAVFLLAIAMRLGLRGLRAVSVSEVEQESRKYELGKIWRWYLLTLFFSALISKFAFDVPQITQIVIHLADLHWAMFFLLSFHVISRRQGNLLLYAATLLEIIFGMTGFFGGFKEVFFILLIALLMFGYRFRPRHLFKIACFVTALFLLSVVWTVIKVDYRDYISQGSRQQVVLVSFQDRFLKIFQLIGDIDSESFKMGIERLFDRIAQVDVFSYTLERVPSVIPYEKGLLWSRAVRHILIPRLFYPNKPNLPSDSVVTAYYTGRQYAGEEEGTSIAIGYVAESYIDFGYVGMYLPIVFVGYLWGFMYKYFVSKAKIRLLGYAVSSTLAIGGYKLEVDNVHLLGGMLTGFIVLALAIRFLMPSIHGMLATKLRITAV